MPAVVWQDVPSCTLAVSGDVPPMRVRALGRTDYAACWQAMRAFTESRGPHTADELWLTEHSPIYTLGLAGRREHVLRDNGIAVVQTDRGGQVTYHGPGQLVLYTLIDLRRLYLGVRTMVRQLEAAVCAWLASFGINAYGKISAPGVYVMRQSGEAKIAALGLKVHRGCTYHGLSVNLAMSLAPFDDINPCGYEHLAVTQLSDLGVAGEACDVLTAGHALAGHVARHLATPGEVRMAS